MAGGRWFDWIISYEKLTSKIRYSIDQRRNQNKSFVDARGSISLVGDGLRKNGAPRNDLLLNVACQRFNALLLVSSSALCRWNYERKAAYFHSLTGARVNFVCLTYLLT